MSYASQAVERAVHIVYDSSKMLTSPDFRDSRTYLTMLMCNIMPFFVIMLVSI